jgi:RNA polymerase sigma-70 factor (ECF subfamily)
MAAQRARDPDSPLDRSWLERFHAGARDVLEGCYRDHFKTVEHAVGQVLRGADKETVIHDVFLRLIASVDLRRGFAGGAFGPWLATVARNQAIDYWRRYRNERPLDERQADTDGPVAAEGADGVEARILVAQFKREQLPAKWAGVFEARFLGGLDQRSAAARLGISRTTLAYQEMQVRRLLKRFLLRAGGGGPR